MRSAHRPLALLAAAALTIGLLTACQTVPNPVATADAPEEIALALHGSYTVMAELTADIVENPATPAQVKNTLAEIDQTAYPVVKQLRPLAEEVQRIRAELAPGASRDEQLAIAIAKLNEWITRAAPLIRDLSAAVKGAR